MTPTRRDFAALTLGLSIAAGAPVRTRAAMARDPLVIGAGGASGDTPAGTRLAYDLAIRDGADVIAADFVPSKDGALMALGDHELSASTDIATRLEFADRRASRVIEGQARVGWFVEDFTLAELKTLVRGAPGAKRRGAAVDPGRTILTFEDLIAIARAGSVRAARVIGVRAGMLQSAYFAGLDLALEPRLADAIRVAGYNSRAAAVRVASADTEALKTIGELTRARRVLNLTDGASAPDAAALTAIHAQAEAVAVGPGLVLDLSQPKTLAPTSLIADAHVAGLTVEAWTSGWDAAFPPPPYRPGDARRLTAALFAAGCDVVAGDLAAPIARAREEATPRDRS